MSIYTTIISVFAIVFGLICLYLWKKGFGYINPVKFYLWRWTYLMKPVEAKQVDRIRLLKVSILLLAMGILGMLLRLVSHE